MSAVQTIAIHSKDGATPRKFRTDIQALRAVAIGLVVLNHLWPLRLTGGYVGVDVFFVISGFLITGHLVAELSRTGGVRLGAFYARRIRRLLPAAFLVLFASFALLLIWVPYARWERNAWEIAASAGYVENWFLAAMSVNYSALNDAASLVQHYWSLSVEEQFYIVWPLLLLGAAALARRTGRTTTRRGRRARTFRALVTVIAVVGILSLAASILYTMAAPAQAYFATFTRAWEFALGGAVALVGAKLSLPRLAANILSLVGFAMIGFSAVIFDHATAFPGYAALLPVLGTVAVVVSGSAHEALWHARVTALRPIQWVGGISYSLYLWHWPLIVVAPFLIGTEASTLSKLAVLAIAVVLATLTKRFVEDKGQAWRYWRSSTRRALMLMIAGMLVIAALVAGVLAMYHGRVDADKPPAEVVAASCEGPAALAPGAACDDPFGVADYVEMTPKNHYAFTPDECTDLLPILTYGETGTTRECDFSDGESDPTKVWLVGDSHAQQWQGAIFDLAKKNGWFVTTSYYGGCPLADVAFAGFRGEWGEEGQNLCRRWSHELADTISAEQPDLVITAMASRLQIADDGSDLSSHEQMVRGLRSYWERWAGEGIRVLAMADPPLNGEVRSPDCVQLNADAPLNCARPRADAQPPDPVVDAAAAADSDLIHLLDLSDRFCDDELCYAVVGQIPVYFDADHLNLEYVRMLGPEIESAVDEVFARG